MNKRRISTWWALVLCLTISCGQGTGDQASESAVEVFSWWTSGSEAAALETVFSAYSRAYPETRVINASIAGGGGSAARPVLQTRLFSGNPPDT